MEPCTGLSVIFSSAALVSASRRRARSASSFSSLASSASNSSAKAYRMAVHALSVTRAYLNARGVQERHQCMSDMPGMEILARRQCGFDQRWLSCAACWQSKTSQASRVITQKQYMPRPNRQEEQSLSNLPHCGVHFLLGSPYRQRPADVPAVRQALLVLPPTLPPRPTEWQSML